MKKFACVLVVICILLCTVGCTESEKVSSNDSSAIDYTAQIEELKNELDQMSSKTEATKQKLKDLQNEIKLLEEENSALEKSMKDIASSTQKTKYTITKKELIGKWIGMATPMVNGVVVLKKSGEVIEFTEDNVIAVEGNWILYKRKPWSKEEFEVPDLIPYVYYDGYLYTTDHPGIYKKK